MTKKLFAIACLLSSQAALARAPASDDLLCLTSGGSHPLQLEFRWLSDAASGWRGAYVKYRSSTSVIPLVLKSSESEVLAAGRPSQFTEVWVEVLKGEVTGEYELTYQGANVIDFSYRNRKSGKQYGFVQDDDAAGGGNCTWR